jgi:DnaJ-class molecular chaperone
MGKLTVELTTEKCSKCDGKGKTEQCEYTPPFERFMGSCPECGGSGVKIVESKVVKRENCGDA